jgi:simple sugar transport system permease protein
MPKRVLFDKNSAAKTSGSDKRKFKFDARNLALIPVIVIMLIFGALTNPAFFTANNLLGNILTTSAVLGIMVIAEGIILIGGFFDLSLQSIVGFAPMTLAVLLSKNSDVPGVGLNIIFAILLTIAAVVIIGLLNGLIVSKMKINAFIATLAMMILVQGFTLGISNGQTYSDLPRFMTFMGDTRILAIPFEAWIFVILFALAYAFMR